MKESILVQEFGAERAYAYAEEYGKILKKEYPILYKLNYVGMTWLFNILRRWV